MSLVNEKMVRKKQGICYIAGHAGSDFHQHEQPHFWTFFLDRGDWIFRMF